MRAIRFRRKAEQLGATVVEEFVDAGESARKADRPELMRTIKYVAEHQVNYCIVHKVDRLARNRADDVTIHLALRDAGVMLVSASENIDETPSGMLLHGIMSSIAEFYSRNLATETVKGLSQKAAQGGTTNKAPIGYVNVGVRDERGRENRTVVIDPERAELVTWAFTVFASGRWTESQLHRELVGKGLTMPPTPKRPEKPIGLSTLHRMLTNPYYKGDVQFKGVTYQGAHEAIVPREVWFQVQSILDSHKSAADATQIHDHYLKGMLYCGACGSRLIITNARSSTGMIYPYFVCSGRHGRKNSCTRQAMLIEDVERLVERTYDSIRMTGDTRRNVVQMMHAELDRLMARESKELTHLATERNQLEDERLKLLQAHYAGAVPLDLLKSEQDRISARLENIANRITSHHDEYAAVRANVDDSLGLLVDIADMYKGGDGAERRLCNQALFNRIFIDEDGEVRPQFGSPFGTLCNDELQANALNWAALASDEEKQKGHPRTGARVASVAESLNLNHLGWLTGLEPATTGTTSRGSTN